MRELKAAQGNAMSDIRGEMARACLRAAARFCLSPSREHFNAASGF